MLLLRLVAVIAVIAIGVNLVLFLSQRDPRHLQRAWRIAQFAVLFALIMAALFFFERALLPIAG
ncbi:MAG: hypothetical protein KF778_22300 [Rhodocyclaceae bacterium]|nr:hypothetical protein [Rhodocyclaceae bacterium]MBX3671138.1 hypothetical protein [Rhodocyclaceae bacterium]